MSWALKSVVIDRLSIAQVADGLGASWHTVNDVVVAAGRALLNDDPGRLEGVRVLGVDEHCWRHTRHSDRFVTVIIDLTPVRDGTGPARLLNTVSGRSTAVFTTWLAAQSPAFRAGIETVAMDRFTGDTSAATEALLDAGRLDRGHGPRPRRGPGRGRPLDRTRQRLQQETCGHRGRTWNPLYGIRRVLRTEAELLTDRQNLRLAAVFTDDADVQVEATRGIYQRIVTAYRHPDRAAGKTALAAVVDALSHDVPPALTELITLGRTLRHRAGDVLAYFDRPGTSNGPTKAINALPRAPARHRPGLPQPHRLHPQITTRYRRLQTATTPSTAMSRFVCRARLSLCRQPRRSRPRGCERVHRRKVVARPVYVGAEQLS